MIFSPILLAPPFHLTAASQAQTRADLLAAYLSGAGVDDGDQPEPAAALGGYRSSTRADGFGVLVRQPIPGVRIDYASPANGIGDGSLRALDLETLVWTPPDDGTAAPPAAGVPVVIALDETKLVAGDDAGQFLLVTRTTASDLVGQSTVRLTRSFNDLFGQSDVDVSVSTAATHRLLVLKAGTGGAVKNLKVWIGTSDGAVRIAREDPASQPDGAFQTIADETAAPAGVTWVSPDSAVHVDVISVPTLSPGNLLGIWMERTAAATASPRQSLSIHWSAAIVS